MRIRLYLEVQNGKPFVDADGLPGIFRKEVVDYAVRCGKEL